MPQNNHILNKRYARALLSLADENNILERSYMDMRKVCEVFAYNKELLIIMKSPMIRTAKKQNVLTHLFGKVLHPLILMYMTIIVRKQRGNMLEGIASAYLTVYKQYLGIEEVKLTTAFPLDDELRSKALTAAKKMTPHRIEFVEEVDPSIIGGFILNLGEKQYNASVKHRLQRFKKHLYQ
ncbi:MAG: ATP synthase F1 subunit delta [Bacteroidia bacterium]|nr:MAG: ATP synthase F1 subunit delta [Bacteroidia bacterium]